MVDTFWNNAWHHRFLRIPNSLPKIQHLADDTDPLVRFSMLDSLLWQKLSSCSRTNTIVVLYLHQIAQTMSIDVFTLYYRKIYIFALAFLYREKLYIIRTIWVYMRINRFLLLPSEIKTAGIRLIAKRVVKI